MAVFQLGVLLAEQQRNAEAIEISAPGDRACSRRWRRRTIDSGSSISAIGRNDLAEKELAVFRELKGKGEDK